MNDYTDLIERYGESNVENAVMYIYSLTDLNGIKVNVAPNTVESVMECAFGSQSADSKGQYTLTPGSEEIR